MDPQKHYWKRYTQAALFGLTVPFATGLWGAWSSSAGFLLALFGLPVAGILLVVLAVVLSARGFRLEHSPPSGWHRVLFTLLPLGLLAGVIFCSLTVLQAGSAVGAWSRLVLQRGHYEAIIDKVRRAPRSDEESYRVFLEDDGVTYVIDYGPPVRVAFNPEGLLDNWSGIIFDPTHAVMLADGFDPVTGEFAAPDRITKLFGGDLVSCRPLGGDYFRCSFT